MERAGERRRDVRETEQVTDLLSETRAGFQFLTRGMHVPSEVFCLCVARTPVQLHTT
jgi:hypothetical protein